MIVDLNSEDVERVAQQVIKSEQLVSCHCHGSVLTQSLPDLDLIQSILDRKILTPDQTYELQCLGIVFGRVLVKNVEGLDWAIIDDEYGRDPTVRFDSTTMVFNVLTILSKRVEKHEDVNIRELYDTVLAAIENVENEVE